MDIYTIISAGYDLLLGAWLKDGSTHPLTAAAGLIPDKRSRVLDMCCGTMSNGLAIAAKTPPTP